MPDISEEFIVKAPIQKTWELLSNMEEMGLCIPGCKEVKKISEDEYEWVIQAKVFFATKTIKAKTKALELNPPFHVTFVGNGELFEKSFRYVISINGTMDLHPISEDETKVIFSGRVNASGLASVIVNKVASGQMKDLLIDFEKKVRSKLEV